MRHLADVVPAAVAALISPGSPPWNPAGPGHDRVLSLHALPLAGVLAADPWADYLALPVAPLVLLLQIGALFVRPRWLRWGISVACVAGIAAMFLYVDSLPQSPDEGANIGAGVLLLWLLVSIGLVLVLVARDLLVLAFRAGRSRSANPS
jgi:hypothetical protein